MHLIHFPYIKPNITNARRRNPYSLKMKVMHTREVILDSFIRHTSNLFEDVTVNEPVAIPIRNKPSNGLVTGSFEWDLRQNWLQLIGHDLMSMIILIIPATLRRALLSLCHNLDLYLTLDDLPDRSLVQTNERVMGVGESIIVLTPLRMQHCSTIPSSDPPVICYSRAVRSLYERVSNKMKPLKMSMHQVAGYRVSKKKIQLAWVLSLRRAPSFVKNILLLFSNKRN